MNEVSLPRPPCETGITKPLTLADIAGAISRDEHLSPSQKSNMCSAIRSLCRALNVSPADAPASLPWLSERTAGLHSVQLGISAKRLANIKSEVARAIKHCIPGPYSLRGRGGLSAPWKGLWDLLPPGKLQYSLSRFLKFLSIRGLERLDVDDSLVSEYRTWLHEVAGSKNPDARVRQTVRAWNLAATSIPGWPQQHLADPYHYQGYTSRWEALPESLSADAEAWLETLRNPDLLDEHAPNRPLSEATIKARRFQIRQIHGALTRQGVAPGSLTTLASLATLDHMKTGLRFFLDRGTGKPSSQTGGIATAMVLIAEHWVRVDLEALNAMKALRKKVTPRYRGMSERNEAALRQFDSERNKRLLINLPAKLRKELTAKSSLSKADALSCQAALALAILLSLPIRRKNLCRLDLEHHFVRRYDGPKERVFIESPAIETKTKEPIAFELSPPAAALLDFYLERCRPLLASHASSWLFPGEKQGCHKSPERVAANLIKLVSEHTGLHVSVHRIRHIVGKIVLDHDPSQFETVRRLLGHRSLSTTVEAYTGLDARVAGQVLDRTLGALRGDEDEHV